MSFIPAHSAIVLYAPDTATLDDNEDSNGIATLGDYPTSAQVLGYTNFPQGSRGLNNSKGFAIGQRGAAYNKRGNVQPQIDLEIRPGSVQAIHDLINDSSGVLPSFCIYVISGTGTNRITDIYRKCKVGSMKFNFAGGQGQGGELTVSASLMALAYEQVSGTPPVTTSGSLSSLGTPLMWHDVRKFEIAGRGLRYALMSLSAELNFNLERKNERPDWGDNNPLSRTSYALLEHQLNVSGEIGLHERLPKDLFDDVANSQDWGDIVINGLDLDGAGFELSLVKCFPSDETHQSAEASAEINYTVPFTANTFAFTVKGGG